MTTHEVFEPAGHSDFLGLHRNAAVWTTACHGVVPGELPDRGSGVAMARQTVRAYDRLRALLEIAGLEPTDVVRVVEVVSVAGLAHYEQAAELRQTFFGAHHPAVTTTVVERLILPDAVLEVQVHAVLGGPRSLVENGAVGIAATCTSSTVAEGHDGAVFLSTLSPVDARGDVVHEGDFVGQYAYCLEQADALLRLAGLSLDAAVTTYDYSTPATRDVYRRSHRVRKDRLGGAGVFPGAGGILMSRLHRPGALVALDVTASRHPLQLVNPGWSRYDTLTYSPAVRAGHTLYTSGFAALDMETQEPLYPGNLAAQLEATYSSLTTLLAHAGLDGSHLLETIEYYTAAAGFPACVRDLADGHPLKARAARRRVAACHELLRGEFLLEVFATAVFPGSCSWDF